MNLFLATTALWLAGPADDHAHGHGPQLGTIAFETTCSAGAEALVNQGLGWLHSFEYEQSARTFAEAAAADPGCAIAYWGAAASYYHPLWAPPSAAELEKGRAAVASAKAAGARSQRERDYVDAIDSFYRDSATRDHKTRALAYSAALEQLHKRYPADREAAVFYSLSLVAVGTMDKDPGFAKEKAAGALLNQVLAQAPDHPGVAHYLIHSFDYPALAELALPAARRYAGIAPASPHAQHMPSHIFIRLGLWDEAIKSNLASEAAARVFAKAQGLPDSSSERLHAMDYLAYGYLQTGQDSQAERVLSELNAIQRADPPIFSVAYAATAIPARLLLERRMWSEAASLELADNVRKLAPLDDFKWGQAHIHFAQIGVNGAIIVWLCGSSTNPGPAGTPACPQGSGTVSGIFRAADVLASPTTQQLSAGQVSQFIEAMRANSAYVNVHTANSSGGEIRGQVVPEPASAALAAAAAGGMMLTRRRSRRR